VFHRRQFCLGGTFRIRCCLRRSRRAGLAAMHLSPMKTGSHSPVVILVSVHRRCGTVPIDGEPTGCHLTSHRPFVYAMTPRSTRFRRSAIDTFKVVRKVQAAPSAMAMRIAPGHSHLLVVEPGLRECEMPVGDLRTTFNKLCLPMEPPTSILQFHRLRR